MSPKDNYLKLWKQAIHLCEIESNEDEAASFVDRYYNHNELFTHLDEKKLLVVFTGLVVYEELFHLRYGSTSPAAWCYQEILNRVNTGKYERDFIYDIGDWAAKYSKNPYVPMGTHHNFGPRDFWKFEEERKRREEEHMKRMAVEKKAKEKKRKKHIEESKQKQEEAKKKHQERVHIIQELRNKKIPEALSYIEDSKKSIFYFIELIEEWFKENNLSSEIKERILHLLPNKSTRHNNRIKNKLIDLYIVKKETN